MLDRRNAFLPEDSVLVILCLAHGVDRLVGRELLGGDVSAEPGVIGDCQVEDLGGPQLCGDRTQTWLEATERPAALKQQAGASAGAIRRLEDVQVAPRTRWPVSSAADRQAAVATRLWAVTPAPISSARTPTARRRSFLAEALPCLHPSSTHGLLLTPFGPPREANVDHSARGWPLPRKPVPIPDHLGQGKAIRTGRGLGPRGG